MRRINLLVFLAAATALICSCKPATPGLVKVEGGLVQGIVEEDMMIFKGIPFAAPPIGDLRWKAPQPVEPWEGVLMADTFSAGPYTNMPFGEQSEDCLYLNVWTPAKSAKEKLPVMVWIYGGGFSMGNAAQYDGSKIAERGVVFVAPNYRVGRLGLMAHPELSAENPNGVSGNYGILDQIAALKWVKENIAQFGGDPDKVTIFGESAGGISVSMLCASPLAAGLFRGAICQSGGSFGPVRKDSYSGENMKTLAMAEAEGAAYAEEKGCASIADLRALDPKTLSQQTLVTGGAWPIVDGYVIPDDQYKMYEAGNFNDVAVIIGYNSDEGDSFGATSDPKQHRADVAKRYGPWAEKLLEVYPITETEVPKTGRDLTRDAAFGWHSWIWGRLQNEKPGHQPVYMYYFNEDPHYTPENPKYGHASPHGQDVNFVFGSFRGEVPESDLVLSDHMITYWTNFAKTCNPNGDGSDPDLPVWPLFENENSQYMMLVSDKPHAIPAVDEDALKVLNDYFAWRRSAEGAEWAANQ